MPLIKGWPPRGIVYSYMCNLLTILFTNIRVTQCAKKGMSDSPGLVDFATCIRILNSVLKLLNGQVKFFGEFKLQKNCNQSCLSNFLGGLLK